MAVKIDFNVLQSLSWQLFILAKNILLTVTSWNIVGLVFNKSFVIILVNIVVNIYKIIFIPNIVNLFSNAILSIVSLSNLIISIK